MSRLGFGPSNLRFALACLGVVVGLSAPLGPSLRSEVLLADEAAGPSVRPQRAEGSGLRPASGHQLAENDGSLSEAELRRAIREIGHLGIVFGRLATYEAAAERRGYWAELRLGYAAAADRLGSLLDDGGLILGDLPSGQSVSSGDAGIVVDTTLDGAWRPDELRRDRAAGEDGWDHSYRLSAAIFEGLAGMVGYQRWVWFDAHLKRSPTAGVMEPGRESVAGPLLTRYWFAKDWHLWAAVAAKTADEQALRALWAARRSVLAAQAGQAVEEAKAGLGEAWHTALAANWRQQAAAAEEIAEALAGVGALAGSFPQASREVVVAVPEPQDRARDEEITALRSRLAELEGRIGELGSQLEQSREEASRLEQELGTARDLAGARATADEALSRAYAELEAAQQADHRRLAELEAEREANQDRVTELEAARTADQSRVTELERRLAALHEELDAAQDRQSQSILSLTRSFSTRQTAVIGLAVLLLLLSIITIAVLLRRTSAAGVAAAVRAGSTQAAGQGATGQRAAGQGNEAAKPTRANGRTARPISSESEALAARKDAPRDRLLALAGERIEIAIPILVRSDGLTDADLIDLIGRTTTQHRMAIAMRPALGRQVVDALVAGGETKVAVAVLQNGGAEITAETFGTLAEQAARLPALKDALLNRPGLPGTVRARLETAHDRPERPPAQDTTEEDRPAKTEEPSTRAGAPRQDLAAKLEAAAAALDAAAEEAGARDRETSKDETEPRVEAAGDAAACDAQATPLAGSTASGEVAPHALIGALRQGKLELFEALFSKMTGLRPPRLQKVVYGAGGENLAITCRALGLGKPVMTSIFIWSRKGRADLGPVNPRELSGAMTAFDETSPEAAQDMISAWIQGEAIPGEWKRRLHGPAAE